MVHIFQKILYFSKVLGSLTKKAFVLVLFYSVSSDEQNYHILIFPTFLLNKMLAD